MYNEIMAMTVSITTPSKKTLDEVTRRIVQVAKPQRVLLFGSAAQGRMTKDSDLDILVDPAPRASLLAMEKLQAQLEKATGIKIDLRTPEEINLRFRGKVLTEAAAL